MTRTLLVELELDDPSLDINILAEEVEDALDSLGLPVVNVKPWQGQGDNLAQTLMQAQIISSDNNVA